MAGAWNRLRPRLPPPSCLARIAWPRHPSPARLPRRSTRVRPRTLEPLLKKRPEYIPSGLSGLVPALSIYPLASPDWSPP
eukprot:1190899-Prorocentrum_minimum.AAC.2